MKENQNPNQELRTDEDKIDRIEKVIYAFKLGAIGVGGVTGWCLIDCDASLKDINLGNEWKGTPKYQTKDENGVPTGNGNAFEDVFYRKMKQSGRTIQKVKEEKDGADFIVDGKPCQLKFGNSPKVVFNKLFEDDKFRYEGQVIITNKENEEELRRLVVENAERFDGSIPEVNPSEIGTCDRRETYTQYKRGFESLQLDLKDILSDSSSMKSLGSCMALAGLVVIAGGCCWEYYKNMRNQRETEKDSKTSTLKKSLLIGWKNYWKWALATCVAVGVCGVAGSLAHRQELLPNN